MKQHEALQAAVEAFRRECDLRVDALEARRDLAKACAKAHAAKLTDAQLARAFARVAAGEKALTRQRIQQIRNGG